MADSDSTGDGTDGVRPQPFRPPLGQVVAVAVAAGVAIGLIAFFLVATPIYMVRAIDLAGDARSWVRNAVIRVAIPIGVISAVAGGVAVGRWRWRGGRLAPAGRRDSPGVTGPPGR